MSILNVPHYFKTIQDAIDAARSGDTIVIAPGIYHESLLILKKEYLIISAHPGTVTLEGSNQNEVGLKIESNHIKIKGIQFSNFRTGIISVGNYNIFDQLTSSRNSQNGLSLIGHGNQVLNCHFSQNITSGISFAGHHNTFKTNHLHQCSKGITALGPAKHNYLIKNVLTHIQQYALGIVASGSNHNVFYKNSIDHCQHGIIIQNGSIQAVRNSINHCSICGIVIQQDKSIISQNTLKSNETGLDLYTDNSEITGNTIQSGHQTGINVNGNHNTITQNIVLDYESVGLIITGYKNHQEHNHLQNNNVNLIENDLKVSLPKEVETTLDQIEAEN